MAHYNTLTKKQDILDLSADGRNIITELCRRVGIASSSELAAALNKLLHDKDFDHIKTVIDDEVRLWEESGHIPANYRLFISSLLSIAPNSEAQREFLEQVSNEHKAKQIVTATANLAAINEAKTPEKGYYADYLARTLAHFSIDTEKIAKDTNNYDSYIRAILDGKVIPTLDQAHEIADLLKLPKQHHASILRMLLLDEARMERFDEHSCLLAKALRGINADTTLPVITSRLYDANGVFNLSYLTSKVTNFRRPDLYELHADLGKEPVPYTEPRVERIATAFATSNSTKDLIMDIGLQNKPRRTFSEIAIELIETGRTVFGTFLTSIFGELAIGTKAAAERLGVSITTIKDWKSPNKRNIAQHQLPSFMQEFGVDRDSQLAIDFWALSCGDLSLGDIDDILQAAEDLFESTDPSSESMQGNVVYKRMLTQGTPFTKTGEEGKLQIEKTLIGNALHLVLYDRFGLNRAELNSRSKIAKATALEFERGNVIVARGEKQGKVVFVPEQAVRLAKAYTTDPNKQKRLTLLFLEITKELSPEQMLSEEPNHGQIIRRSRLQRFESLTDFRLNLEKATGKKISSARFCAYEHDNETIKKENAVALALHIGFDPKTQECHDFLAMTRGQQTGVNQELLLQTIDMAYSHMAGINKDEEGEDIPKKSFADVMDIAILLAEQKWGATSNEAFGKLVPFDNPRYDYQGLSLQSIGSYRTGGYAGSDEPMEAIAKLFEFDEAHTAKFVRVSTNRVPKYDSSLMDSVSPNSGDQEKAQTLFSMRKNMGFRSALDAAKAWGVGVSRYQLLESHGRFTRGQPSGARTFLETVATNLIPAEFHEHRENFPKLFLGRVEQTANRDISPNGVLREREQTTNSSQVTPPTSG